MKRFTLPPLLTLIASSAFLGGCISEDKGVNSSSLSANSSINMASSSSMPHVGQSSIASSMETQSSSQSSLSLRLDSIDFGDHKLRSCVYDTGKTYIHEVTGIDCHGYTYIKDTTGIEQLSHLRSIKNLLNITSINLASLTELRHLELPDNTLETLDLSANTQLTHIDLTRSSNYLFELDFSALTQLDSLVLSSAEFQIKDNAQLQQLTLNLLHFSPPLDLSLYTNLASFNLLTSSINHLDLSSNNKLHHLGISTTSTTSAQQTVTWPSNNAITSLRVHGKHLAQYFTQPNPQLTSLSLSANDLTDFDLTPLTSLKSLSITYPSVSEGTVIGLSSQHQLESLEMKGVQFTGLEMQHFQALTTLVLNASHDHIDLSHAAQLQSLTLVDTNLKSLNLSSTPMLKNLSLQAGSAGVDITWNAQPTIEHLELGHYIDSKNSYDFSHLTTLKSFRSNSLGMQTLDLSHNLALEIINIFYAAELNTVHLPNTPTLKNIAITNAALSDINTQQLTGLETLSLDNIFPTEFMSNPLILPASQTLNTVSIENLQLHSIETSQATNLLNLTVISGRLQTLDLSANTQLQHLNLEGNKLDSLTLNGLTELVTANLKNNQLVTLDIDNLPKLSLLDIANNPLNCSSVDACLDTDQDSVNDAADLCPNTQANTEVDLTGCRLAGTYRVRVFYHVPSDRTVKSDYKAAIENSAALIKEWYAGQLGTDKTFLMVDDGEATVFHSTHNTEWFNNFNKDIGVNSLTNWFAWFGIQSDLNDNYGNRPENEVWMILSDVDSDCNFNAGGGVEGITVMPSDDIKGLMDEPLRCSDDLGFDRWIGGQAHELGHSLGLRHPFDENGEAPGYEGVCPNGDCIMQTGYLSYPNTYLNAVAIEQLDNSKYFRFEP